MAYHFALATSLTGYIGSEEVVYAFDNGCEINLDPNVQLILAIKESFFVVSWLIQRLDSIEPVTYFDVFTGSVILSGG